MGRFRLLPDDDDDDDGEWEFVGDSGQKGALLKCSSQPQPYNNNIDCSPSFEEADSAEPTTLLLEASINHDEDHQVGTFHPNFVVAQASSSSKRFYAWTFWVSTFLILVIAWGLHNQDLLPPPSSASNHGWKDYYLLQNFTRALAWNTTPFHVGWVLPLRSLYADLLERQQHWAAAATHSQVSACNRPLQRTIMRQSEYHDDSLFDTLRSKVVGQDPAIRVLLDTWGKKRWQTSTSTAPQRPLLLFFAGSSSVGKTTLARSFWRHAMSSNDCMTTQHQQSSLLELSSAEFASNDDDGSIQQQWLMHRILSHVQQYPSGAMIILRNVQDIKPPLLLDWLTEQLLFSSETGELEGRQQHSFGDVRQQCANTVFVFTSTSSSSSILGRDIPYQQASGAADRALLQQVADAVVPFGPLTQRHLAEIVRRRFQELSDAHSFLANENQQSSDTWWWWWLNGERKKTDSRLAAPEWQELVVTEQAVQALVSASQVCGEYYKNVEWPSNPTALQGAQGLSNGLQQVESKLHWCFGKELRPSDDSAETAVIEYDQQEEYMLLLWCASAGVGDVDDSDNLNRTNCHQVCRLN